MATKQVEQPVGIVPPATREHGHTFPVQTSPSEAPPIVGTVAKQGHVLPDLLPPKSATFKVDEPIQWAKQLIRELAKTGTGEGPLNMLRDAVYRRWNDPIRRHGPVENRHLTALEALAILDRMNVGPLDRNGVPIAPEAANMLYPRHTFDKAKALIEQGEWTHTIALTVHPSEMIPEPTGTAPAFNAELFKLDQNEVESEPGELPVPMGRAGVVDIGSLGATGIDNVPTVGPRSTLPKMGIG